MKHYNIKDCSCTRADAARRFSLPFNSLPLEYSSDPSNSCPQLYNIPGHNKLLYIPIRAIALIAAVVTQRLVVGTGLTTTVSTTSASSTSTTAPASTTATTSTSVTNVRTKRSSVKSLQLRRNFLLSFSHDLTQVTSQFGVGIGEERNSSTGGAGSSGTTNSVDIVLDVTGHVVVDHVSDTLDVWKLV